MNLFGKFNYFLIFIKKYQVLCIGYRNSHHTKIKNLHPAPIIFKDKINYVLFSMLVKYNPLLLFLIMESPIFNLYNCI